MACTAGCGTAGVKVACPRCRLACYCSHQCLRDHESKHQESCSAPNISSKLPRKARPAVPKGQHQLSEAGKLTAASSEQCEAAQAKSLRGSKAVARPDDVECEICSGALSGRDALQLVRGHVCKALPALSVSAFNILQSSAGGGISMPMDIGDVHREMRKRAAVCQSQSPTGVACSPMTACRAPLPVYQLQPWLESIFEGSLLQKALEICAEQCIETVEAIRTEYSQGELHLPAVRAGGGSQADPDRPRRGAVRHAA
jgi:hypothetical protein